MLRMKEEDVFFVVTKSDVDAVAEELGISKPTQVHYRAARQYILSFCTDGAYTWKDAIVEALQDQGEEESLEHAAHDHSQ